MHRLLSKTKKLPIKLPIKPRVVKETVKVVIVLKVSSEIGVSRNIRNSYSSVSRQTIIAPNFPVVWATAETCTVCRRTPLKSFSLPPL